METTLELLKALSDKNRLCIMAALNRYEELCACQITELLQVSGATASRHLSVLQHAGLLESRKAGRWVYFRLAPSADSGPVLEWLASVFEQSADTQSDMRKLDVIVKIDTEDLCRIQRGEECCPK